MESGFERWTVELGLAFLVVSFAAHVLWNKKKVLYVRVYTRCKNDSCETIQRLFEMFGREKSCMIEQEPFLLCVNSILCTRGFVTAAW